MDIRQGLLEVLKNQGYYIEDEEEDINILEFIADSMEFVEFVVAIEEQLNIVFPDEYLTMDCLESLNGLVNILVNSQEKEEEYGE